jgi:hypothetical protein
VKLPDEDIATPEIARAFAVHFGAADRLFEYVKDLLGGTRLNLVERIHYCEAPVLTRLLRLHYTVSKLASVGLGSEAKMAVRSIFENVVNLYALEHSADREEYARRWIAWDLVNFMKQVDAEIRLHPHNEPLFAEIRGIAGGVEREIREESRILAETHWPAGSQKARNFIDKRWQAFRNRGPSMKNMRALAQEVDGKTGGATHFAASYDFVYQNASGVVHGSEISRLIDQTPTQIVLKLAPTTDEIESVLMSSNVWLSMGAASVCRVLHIGPPDATAILEAMARPSVAHLLERTEGQ